MSVHTVCSVLARDVHARCTHKVCTPEQVVQVCIMWCVCRALTCVHRGVGVQGVNVCAPGQCALQCADRMLVQCDPIHTRVQGSLCAWRRSCTCAPHAHSCHVPCTREQCSTHRLCTLACACATAAALAEHGRWHLTCVCKHVCAYNGCATPAKCASVLRAVYTTHA